jgi:hypothetical protein
MARIYEGIGDLNTAVEHYKKLLTFDRFVLDHNSGVSFLSMQIAYEFVIIYTLKFSTNVEAIASLAAHNFYNDQPEYALQYYRFASSIIL